MKVIIEQEAGTLEYDADYIAVDECGLKLWVPVKGNPLREIIRIGKGVKVTIPEVGE